MGVLPARALARVRNLIARHFHPGMNSWAKNLLSTEVDVKFNPEGIDLEIGRAHV
jgi:hypothetical protein